MTGGIDGFFGDRVRRDSIHPEYNLQWKIMIKVHDPRTRVLKKMERGMKSQEKPTGRKRIE